MLEIDKERIAAALENNHIVDVINKGLATSEYVD